MDCADISKKSLVPRKTFLEESVGLFADKDKEEEVEEVREKRRKMKKAPKENKRQKRKRQKKESEGRTMG